MCPLRQPRKQRARALARVCVCAKDARIKRVGRRRRNWQTDQSVGCPGVPLRPSQIILIVVGQTGKIIILHMGHLRIPIYNYGCNYTTHTRSHSHPIRLTARCNRAVAKYHCTVCARCTHTHTLHSLAVRIFSRPGFRKPNPILV